MPEDLQSQLPWIRRLLAAYRIPILELAGYEADDVLGTLSCRAAEAGYQVVLVSADKDLMQLVEPRVSLYHTGRNKLYGPQEVTEDFGVPPEKVADVLALMGDSIDNIPGVPGIGEKGAKSLIQEYGSLEDLLARAGEVTRKAYREGLEQHAGAGAAVEGAVDHPHQPRGAVRPRGPAPRSAGRRGAAPGAHRAGVLLARRGAGPAGATGAAGRGAAGRRGGGHRRGLDRPRRPAGGRRGLRRRAGRGAPARPRGAPSPGDGAGALRRLPARRRCATPRWPACKRWIGRSRGPPRRPQPQGGAPPLPRARPASRRCSTPCWSPTS